MNLTKTFGGLTVSTTPAPLPGVTFVPDGPPGEFLDMDQVRELRELLGDALGEARCTIGVNENDVLERWRLRHENAEEESDELANLDELPRDVAVLLLYQAFRNIDLINWDVTYDLIDDALADYAGDGAVVSVGESSPQEKT